MMNFLNRNKKIDHPAYLGEGFTYDDVLLVPKLNSYGSRKNVSIKQTDKSGLFSLEVPLISANMDMITSYEMANYMGSRGAIGALHRLMPIHHNVDAFKKCTETCFVSIGCNEKGMKRARALYEAGARWFNLDIAHGHASDMGSTLTQLRKELPDIFIMAGNVATLDGAQYLYDYGAQMVKVGIGGGSACTTREKTGFGVPTVTSLMECSKVDCSIVADGGIRKPADVVKALAFGADFVMLGGMLSATGPTPGETIEREGKKYKVYRGLDSRETQLDWFGEVPDWRTPEGVSMLKPLNEGIDHIIDDIIGGVRSALTYCGAENIGGLRQKFEFRLISSSSYAEGTAHGLSN